MHNNNNVQTSDEDIVYECEIASDHDLWSTVLLQSKMCAFAIGVSPLLSFLLSTRAVVCFKHKSSQSGCAGVRVDVQIACLYSILTRILSKCSFESDG